MTRVERAPLRRPQTSLRQSGDRAYAALFEGVLLPVWERAVCRRDTLAQLTGLEESQWDARDTRDKAQASALHELLCYAGRNVPYYRELFRKCRFDPRGAHSRAHLAELPLLTREIIAERYDDLIDPAHRRRNGKPCTSLSSGKAPAFEYSGAGEGWRQAVTMRADAWAGYRPGRKGFFYSAGVAGRPLDLKSRLGRALRRETSPESTHADDAARRKALELFKQTRPDVMICDAESGAEFAGWIVEQGLRDWDDLPVICSSESGLLADRAVLSQAFGPGIFETYGSRKTLLVGAECQEHTGLHVSEENVIVELLELGMVAPSPTPTGLQQPQPNRQPAGRGELGDVVVTNLHNYGMPMIRYLTGDVARLASEEPCRCGRSLVRLEH